MASRDRTRGNGMGGCHIELLLRNRVLQSIGQTYEAVLLSRRWSRRNEAVMMVVSEIRSRSMY